MVRGSSHAEEIRNALRTLGPALDELTGAIELSVGYPDIFGPLWDGHGLHERSDRLFDQGTTETVLTRRLAHFLSPSEMPGGVGEKRTFAFLSALLEAAQLPERPTIGFAPGSLKVTAEAPVRSRLNRARRLDLFITWASPDGLRFCVAVEAKLGAPDQPGQLRVYRDHCRRHLGPEGGLHWCVYLTRDGRSAPGRLRESWYAASWLGLLRRWEMALASDRPVIEDTDFVRFRRSLWAVACPEL